MEQNEYILNKYKSNLDSNSNKDYFNDRILGLGLNMMGDIIKYSSLIGGIYAITKDNPEFFDSALCGITYGLSSIFNYSATLIATKTDSNSVEDSINNLEKKILDK